MTPESARRPAKLVDYALVNPKADWITLYNQSFNFAEANKPTLNVDFVINALIVQDLMRKKGFQAVIAGKNESGNNNYFRALETVAGIAKENFNAEVRILIKAT